MMPKIGNENTEILLVACNSVDGGLVGRADKAEYSLIKDRKTPMPRAATIVLYGVKWEGDVVPTEPFDLQYDEFLGVMVRSGRIKGLKLQEMVEGKWVCLAQAQTTIRPLV
jgi:hypothetical protein